MYFRNIGDFQQQKQVLNYWNHDSEWTRL